MPSRKKASKLPAALVKNARAAAVAGKSRHLADARALVELVLEKKRVISDAFYDIGDAVVRLRAPHLFQALGRKTHAEVVTKDLGLSIAAAHELAGIAESFPRAEAIELGQEKAHALVLLAKASRGNATPLELAKERVALPGRHGKTIPGILSANALKREARDLRRSHAKRSTPHAVATREAHEAMKSLEAALRKARMPHATAEANAAHHAGEPQEMEARLTVPLASLGAAADVIRKWLAARR